jgi:hypothetical protein
MKYFVFWIKIVAWTLGLFAAGLLVVLLAVSWTIGRAVEDFSREATAKYGGDRVEALIAQVDCQTCSLDERNHAVWALGQLTDKRALPVLRKYYTGEPCDHSRLICQREITKAIRWTEGNSFMLPRVWRVMLSEDQTAAARSPKK